MFYETKLIDGVLHERYAPDDVFIICSLENVTGKFLDLREENKKQSLRIDRLNEQVTMARRILTDDR